jgi:SAM-dependent methyltransferase
MPEGISACVICSNTNSIIESGLTRFLNLPAPFHVERCSNCGMRWLNPRPTNEEYTLIYSAAYFSSSERALGEYNNLPEWVRQFNQVSDYENAEAIVRETWYQARLARLKRFHKTAKTLFDVGAATGEFLAAGKKAGWEVSGVELSAYAVSVAWEKHGIELLQSGLRDANLEGKQYDVVHLSHVFEHFNHPHEELEHLKLLMDNSSLLVIEIPNQFHGWREQLIRQIKQNQQPRTLYSIHHPFFYGIRQITGLMQSHDLEIVSVTTYFPERWQGSFRNSLVGRFEWLADLAAKAGENIEIIARKKQVN